ncbi:sodium-dependent glucose transporter 1B-like isoform X2 [Stegodyphus dumicola]|uniref:sodium-dependent glucose transporter 1B-like isoform X2 n=1 Tax=Stegodyphus dumicola TaxID=202533 RepID=UPI0015AA1010|nr:sodium-dependent glucose transporter 1B-like isoform X2 [Stegodyphus dumicola]XP_035210591.1 sodium-dependent glucose transporter 1B-like isoform X2 [Stegodyphus dumicola]
MLSGIIIDQWKKEIPALLIFNLITAIGVFFIPWSRQVEVLITIMAISGLSMGALDTGGNVWCLNLWKNNNGPYMQALHFLFGVGAFISPLIIAPFLSQQQNVSTLNTTDSNGLKENSTDHNLIPSITYAYGILGIISFIVTMMFIFLLFVSSSEELQEDHKNINNGKRQDRSLSITFIFFTILLLSVYAGIEIGYAQMLSTFAVKSHLQLSKETASYMTSVFWATFTFGRGLAILLAVKIRPFMLIIVDFVFMVISSSLLLPISLGNKHEILLWTGTAVLGLSLASFYPSTISWAENHVNISNKVASLFVIAASLGETVVPLTVSQYVDKKPQVLLYIVMISVVLCGALIFILWLLTFWLGNKHDIEENLEIQLSASSNLVEIQEQIQDNNAEQESEVTNLNHSRI